MLFLQPVVVNDVPAAAVDRATPAEVRMVERRAPEQPRWTGWTGTVVAQNPLDSRSPFGANATDKNDLTPPAPPPANPANAITPPGTPAGNTANSATNTRTPAVDQPDAGPPPPVTPVPSPASPSSTPAAGTAGTSGTMMAPGGPPPAAPLAPSDINRSSSSVLPGASSGASNTR